LHVGSGVQLNSSDRIIDSDLEVLSVVEQDHDYFESLLTLSHFVEEIDMYIAGFVVKKYI